MNRSASPRPPAYAPALSTPDDATMASSSSDLAALSRDGQHELQQEQTATLRSLLKEDLVDEAGADEEMPSWLVEAAERLQALEASALKPAPSQTDGLLDLALRKPQQPAKLGLRLQVVEGVVTVLAVTKGSLAAIAGLEPGDRLLKVGAAEIVSGDQAAALLSEPLEVIRMQVKRVAPVQWEPPRRGEAPATKPAGRADQVAASEQQKLEEWAREETARRSAQAATQAEARARALARARDAWRQLDAEARAELNAKASSLLSRE